MPVTETMLAFLDTETTGLVRGEDEVVEIATILTNFDLTERARFEAKIRTTKRPPPEVAAINGWDEATWAREAIPFSRWVAWLKAQIPFGQVAVPVGANPGFDRDIIHAKYYAPGSVFFPLSYRCIDLCALGNVMRIAGRWKIPNCKLVSLAQAVGHPHVSHRAMGDVEAGVAVFQAVLGVLKEG